MSETAFEADAGTIADLSPDGASGTAGVGAGGVADVDKLLAIALDTACEAVRARESALELRRAADAMAGKVPVNENAIRQVAKAYGIPVRHRQLRHIALNLSEVLLDDISNADSQPCRTVRAFAPERNLREWERRGVLPLGAYHEAARSILVARRCSGHEGEAERDGDAESAERRSAVARQTERCQLALAYPAGLAAHIARAALAGDTTPMLGIYDRI